MTGAGGGRVNWPTKREQLDGADIPALIQYLSDAYRARRHSENERVSHLTRMHEWQRAVEEEDRRIAIIQGVLKERL